MGWLTAVGLFGEVFVQKHAYFKVANERLTLNKDGTFLQKVTLMANQKVDIAQGKWTYVLNDSYLRFDNNFLVVVDGFMELKPNYLEPKEGAAFLPAEIFFGNIRIGSTEVVLYEKIDKE